MWASAKDFGKRQGKANAWNEAWRGETYCTVLYYDTGQFGAVRRSSSQFVATRRSSAEFGGRTVREKEREQAKREKSEADISKRK